MTLLDPYRIPPTMEMVEEFLRQLGSDLSAQDFFDFYESKGWKVGRVMMKNWQAAARRAHRTWGRPSAGQLTEWERKMKSERLVQLRDMRRDITHPGGSAYPVSLDEAKFARCRQLTEEINKLKKELGL